MRPQSARLAACKVSMQCSVRPVGLTSSTLRRVVQLSMPIVLQNLLQYSLVIISTVFVGHLGDPTIMSGAVLAGSFFNVTGYTLIVGLAGAMDSFCGQVMQAAV
jgi:multidrug resistance protein, MATE family